MDGNSLERKKYVAYPEYKDSGVEWLGSIPAHWEVTRLKHMAQIKNGQDYKAVETSKGYPVLGSGGKFTYATKFLYNKESVLLGRKGTIDKPLYINEPFWTVDTMYYTEVNKDVPAKYLHYLALTIQFNRYSTNTALPSMTQEHLGNYSFGVPPVRNEREHIQNFLDHETAKIDTLIEEQQSLIRLLKEKRQAVISHAVTKGLNPDAPMKDSGVEWLGEVPEHWTVTKLKYQIESMDQGWSPQCDSRPADDEEYGVLKVGCVNGGAFNPNENKALPKGLTPRLEYLLQKGQLLISRANTKELVGSAAVVDKEYSNLLVCDKLYRITLQPEINPDFVGLLLSTPAYREQIELGATGASSSMQNIGQSTIRELYVALPEPSEINNIIGRVALSTSKYDQLITEAQSAITYMQERRTALISAAVTGKIDVRDWQPEAQQQEHPTEATA